MRARSAGRGAGFAGGRSYQHAHGIFIGVQQAVDTGADPARRDIGPENDAWAMSGALAPALFTNTRLIGKGATRSSVLAKLEDVMQGAAPGDLVIAYVAVDTVPRYQDLYLLPADHDGSAFFATSISFRLVSAVLGSMPGVKSLVILDASHSGGVGFDMSKYRSGSECCLMVACGPAEYALADRMDGRMHGVFTWSLVEAAREWSLREGPGWTMSLIDWFDRAYTLTLRHADDRQWARQHPVLMGTLSPNLIIRARRGTDLGDPTSDGMPARGPAPEARAS